jgi:hypothetical protein
VGGGAKVRMVSESSCPVPRGSRLLVEDVYLSGSPVEPHAERLFG